MRDDLLKELPPRSPLMIGITILITPLFALSGAVTFTSLDAFVAHVPGPEHAGEATPSTLQKVIVSVCIVLVFAFFASIWTKSVRGIITGRPYRLLSWVVVRIVLGVAYLVGLLVLVEAALQSDWASVSRAVQMLLFSASLTIPAVLLRSRQRVSADARSGGRPSGAAPDARS